MFGRVYGHVGEKGIRLNLMVKRSRLQEAG